MPDPLAPHVGWGVLHLFCQAGPLAEGEAVAAAVKAAEGDDVQVVPVAMLGHKADLAFMALGADLWRLRQLQTELTTAGLEVVDSYVSLTELSEYAQGVPEEMRQARLHPQLPPEGKAAFCFYPMSKRRGDVSNWFTLPYDDRKELMYAHGASGRKFAGRVLQVDHGLHRASTTSSGASPSSPSTRTTSRRSSTRCASTRPPPSTRSSDPSTRAWWHRSATSSPPSGSTDPRSAVEHPQEEALRPLLRSGAPAPGPDRPAR